LSASAETWRHPCFIFPTHGLSRSSSFLLTSLALRDVESRRKFIEDNALDVKNLDI